MKSKNNIFHAKILLFGEYTIIFNSRALTIPFTYFNGHFNFIDYKKYTRVDEAVKSNQQLRSYLTHIKDEKKFKGIVNIDISQFEKDIEQGLYFESNIPQCYGVGSSGALVAAIYHRYGLSPEKGEINDSIQMLKKIFSLLESYFHGTSSGMDPLNCYISEPLLVHNEQFIEKVEVPHKHSNMDGAVFLLNSGYPGNTEPLVAKFLQKTTNSSYKDQLFKEIIPLNNTCINQLVQGDIRAFFQNLKTLSKLQLNNFREMIPEKFLPIWREGLQDDHYYLKLCGSGGGGFILGFTTDYKQASDIMKKKGFEIIPVFKNVK